MDLQRMETQSIATQAARWLRVMETATPQERAQYWEWLAASPSHVRELILAARMDQELREIDPDRHLDVQQLIVQSSSNVSPIREGNEPNIPVKSRQTNRSILKLGAFLTLVLMTAWSVHFAWGLRGTYVTELGEQHLFELADGSTMFLNTQSCVKVNFSAEARDVYLNAGQALFQVRHDAKRPFRVHAAKAVIQAIGTQFDVRLDANRTMVAVVEGTVQVSTPQTNRKSQSELGNVAPQAPAKITAGKGAIIDAAGRINSQIQIDAAAVTAWRQQRLVFRGETLSQIATEFNRYNERPRLRVEGNELAARRFYGVFGAHNPDSLLKYLAQDETIELGRNAEEIVIRPRGTQTTDVLQELPSK